jgi:hypothetical protein
MAQAAEQVFGGGTQVEHRRAAVQQLTVALTQHGTASGGQHAIAAPGNQVGDDLGLDVPEGLFTVAFKELPDAAADALLDFLVRVDKRHADLACQLFADGGLATAGHADECEFHIQGQLFCLLTVKANDVPVPRGLVNVTLTTPLVAVSKL